MSSSSNNSSNLSGNLNIQTITSSGARLLMTIPLSGFSGGAVGACPEKCDGITAGVAIRYDNTVGSVSYGKYIVAQADTPENSEVVGIIEDVSISGDPLVGDTGIATVVISGQINLADGALWAVGGSTGSAGGNDVYFLSAATGGALQNLAPTESTQVIKPIYQVAPNSPWTGQVVNYIGYQSGGQMVAEEGTDTPVAAIREIIGGLGGESRVGWIDMGSVLNLDGDLGDTYGYAYERGGLGKISETVVRCYFKTAPTASMVNQIFKMRIDGKLKITGQVTNVSVANKYADIRFQASEYNNLGTYITEDNYFTTGSGALIQLSSTTAKYLSYTLPTVSANTSKKDITLVINNEEVKKLIEYKIYVPKDLAKGDWNNFQTHAITVPTDMTVGKITVNETLKIENDTYQVTDLVKTMKEVIDQVNTLTKRTGGSSDTFTSAYGSDK